MGLRGREWGARKTGYAWYFTNDEDGYPTGHGTLARLAFLKQFILLACVTT